MPTTKTRTKITMVRHQVRRIAVTVEATEVGNSISKVRPIADFLVNTRKGRHIEDEAVITIGTVLNAVKDRIMQIMRLPSECLPRTHTNILRESRQPTRSSRDSQKTCKRAPMPR
jgi:hypothetical protein